jgi:hypothetical protein
MIKVIKTKSLRPLFSRHSLFVAAQITYRIPVQHPLMLIFKCRVLCQMACLITLMDNTIENRDLN